VQVHADFIPADGRERFGICAAGFEFIEMLLLHAQEVRLARSREVLPLPRA
jgi:hypothetical protein